MRFNTLRKYSTILSLLFILLFSGCFSTGGSLIKAKNILNPVFEAENSCTMLDQAKEGLGLARDALKSEEEAKLVQARAIAAQAAFIVASCEESKENWEIAVPLVDVWYENASPEEKEQATYTWLMTHYSANENGLDTNQIAIAEEFVENTSNPIWRNNIKNILE